MFLNNRAIRSALVIPVSAWFLAIITGAGHSTQYGKASWYALTSITASGERANPDAMTVAHRSLSFGTRIRVTNLRNSQSVILCVNDRGPFIEHRIVDVTKAAAQKLGFVQSGLTDVRVDVVESKYQDCK